MHCSHGDGRCMFNCLAGKHLMPGAVIMMKNGKSMTHRSCLSRETAAVTNALRAHSAVSFDHQFRVHKNLPSSLPLYRVALVASLAMKRMEGTPTAASPVCTSSAAHQLYVSLTLPHG